jgi:hypothetical protein
MSDIEMIELSIEEAKKMIEKKNLVEKLMRNREYRRIIEDGYFKEEAARLAGCSADPAMEQYRDDIFLGIQAISKLQQYMRTLVQMGNIAERDLNEHNEALDELRAEEAV